MPEIAICQKGEMSMTGSAFLMTPRNSAPSTAPPTEPMPPAIEMPPMTQAAIDVELEAAGDVDVGDGVARDPEIAAEARRARRRGTKAMKRVRPTSMPA